MVHTDKYAIGVIALSRQSIIRVVADDCNNIYQLLLLASLSVQRGPINWLPKMVTGDYVSNSYYVIAKFSSLHPQAIGWNI